MAATKRDAEYTAVTEAIDAVAVQGKVVKIAKMEPGHVVSASASLPITPIYLRAIAKIAFHYLLGQVPVFTGHEQVFYDVKRFIMTGEGFERQIRLSADPIIDDLRWGGGVLRYYTHFVQADVSYMEVVVRVKLFAGPAISPPTWVVRVARNPSYVFTGSVAHAFVLTGTADDGHQGEMTALTCVSRNLLPLERR